MSNDDGYTLVEMLVALVILGLAIGGIAQGTHLINSTLRSIEQLRADATPQRAARHGLEKLLANEGPFRANDPTDFTGAGDEFNFACGVSRCGAKLRSVADGTQLQIVREGGSATVVSLRNARNAHFIYQSDAGDRLSWPIHADGAQPLSSIVLVADLGRGPAPYAASRLWRSYSGDCQYNTVNRSCRPGAGR